MKVGIFIGSESDYDIVKEALVLLKEFDVSFDLRITSAHRTPERTVKLIEEMEKKGAILFIAVAGKAAHLAGVVASHTCLPVIGVPVGSSSLNGLDALLSTVQMPKGVPVATMGLDKSGAANAALLAIEILSVKEESLREKMKKYRKEMAVQIEKSSEKLKQKT
ncbi:MAG: 5-(carboxyamino)imidazole ribonucleotide mutase [Candidatus Aminicenantaceae bacterium]